MRGANIVLVLALVAGLMLVSHASAAIIADVNSPVAYSLDYVNSQGGIQVGHLVFSDFIVDSTKSVGAVAPELGEIDVTGVNMSGQNGLRFAGLWSAGSGQLADSVIIYKVTADQGFAVSGNSLEMSGYLADNGGRDTISEAIYASNPDTTLQSALLTEGAYFDSGTGAKKELDQQVFAAPLNQLWVLKDVGANGGIGDQGIAKISAFYQTFVQVPEPATLALLGAGLLLVRRRRH